MNKEKCVYCAYLRDNVCAIKKMPINFIGKDCLAFYKIPRGKVKLCENGKRMVTVGR